MENIEWAPHTIDARKKQVGENPLLMTTYRKGTKWLRPELVDTRLGLVPAGGNVPFATAKVVSVKFCRFADIDETDHSRQSSEMTVEDRLGVMQRAYGEYDMDTLTTVVTLGDIQAV